MSLEIPIPTVHLFPKLDSLLLNLLRSLGAEEWHSSTIAKPWTVKDIAAHLLDGNLRTLSMSRDGFFGDPPSEINDYQDLVAYLNRLNADWVKATKRLSPAILIELLELTGKAFCAHLQTLDPFAPALFSVAWAGEHTSKNWFHIAREYTEKWIHQQQIRDALDKPGLMTRALFYPFIDTLMQGLPHAYRSILATDGTTIQITITTDIGGNWYLTRKEQQWQFSTAENPPAATVEMNPDTAWRLFSKGITPATARSDVYIFGEPALAEPALHMISVMA